MNVSCWIVLLFFFASGMGWSAPSLNNRAGPSKCFVNPSRVMGRARALGASPVAGLPNYQVLVLRVQFSNLSFQAGDDPGEFFNNVVDFFEENSQGVFHPTFTLSAVFTLPHTENTYGADCGGDVACNTPRLISEAVAAANPTVNFSAFDQIMIYHAGYGQESRGNSSDIWSVFFPSSEMSVYGYSAINADGKSFDGSTIVPEREFGAHALGVICHEYGHQLGLPDLYDTSTPGGTSMVGPWDLMDNPWVGGIPGAHPPHLGAWSKKMLGFADPPAASTGTVALNPVEAAPGMPVEIFREGQEYFLMEYRHSGVGNYDRYIPQTWGLLVWHIDRRLAEGASSALLSNTVNVPSLHGHLGVDVVEADGISGNDGANDGLINGQSLSAPQTDLFSGQPTDLSIFNVSGVGLSTATATVTYRGAQSAQSVARLVSYPNPAGKSTRAGAPSGTLSTLRLQLDRPLASTSTKVRILTRLGQVVKTFMGSDFSLRGDLSTDNHWVYELDWDGLNDGGEPVASGIYLIFYEVEGSHGVKTLAVQK